MGIAALVLGIVSFIFALIPFCGYIAFVPAVVGLVLGIVDVSKKGKEGEAKGQGIAGIVLNSIALVFIIFYTMFFVDSAKTLGDELNNAIINYNTIDYNNVDYE